MVAIGGDVVSGRGETHTIGFFDAPAEKPTVIEFTDRIPRNNTFKVMPSVSRPANGRDRPAGRI